MIPTSFNHCFGVILVSVFMEILFCCWESTKEKVKENVKQKLFPYVWAVGKGEGHKNFRIIFLSSFLR